MAGKFQPFKIINPTGKHTGTIFFFHGAGDTGPGICNWVKELTDNNFVFPHLKVIFPTSPKRPYKAFGGEPANVWFDRHASSITVPEHKETLNEACEDLLKLVQEEMTENKISEDRIILGGYSMGGAMAMHLGFRKLSNIAGVFAMSSFLNHDTNVYKEIETRGSSCPIFMAHGRGDTLINYKWGQETFENLKKVGVDGEFNYFSGDHELSKTIMFKLKDWILHLVPEENE